MPSQTKADNRGCCCFWSDSCSRTRSNVIESFVQEIVVTEEATPVYTEASGSPTNAATGWKSITLDNEGPEARSTISETSPTQHVSGTLQMSDTAAMFHNDTFLGLDKCRYRWPERLLGVDRGSEVMSGWRVGLTFTPMWYNVVVRYQLLVVERFLSLVLPSQRLFLRCSDCSLDSDCHPVDLSEWILHQKRPQRWMSTKRCCAIVWCSCFCC